MGTGFRQIQNELFAVGTQNTNTNTLYLVYFYYFSSIFFFWYVLLTFYRYLLAMRLNDKYEDVLCITLSQICQKSERFNLLLFFFLLNFIICKCILLQILLFWLLLFCHVFRFVSLLFCFEMCSNLRQFLDFLIATLKLANVLVVFVVVEHWTWSWCLFH